MAEPESSLLELFNLVVPKEFLTAVAGRMGWIYKTAFRQCDQLEKEQAQDFRPYMRWILLESELRKLARKHGIAEAAKMNCAKSQHHVEVSAGRVIITASAVDTPIQVPRRAIFRDTLACDNSLWLFPEFAPPAPPDDAPLYAVLIHAPKADDQRAPWFANIRFPLPDCKKWATGKIELLKDFTSARDAKETFEEERVEDQVLTQLRDDAAKNTGKSERA
jgi:hypothetical protein